MGAGRATGGCAAALAVATLACGGPRPEPSPLTAVPAEADLVIAIDVDAVRGTWLASSLTALAGRIGAPPCVVARAQAAATVAIAWSEQLPDDGWLIAMRGATTPPCPALLARGAIATWHDGLAPRADGDDGFFDRERKARLGRLRRAPARALGDYELSPGIVATFSLAVDPRDGVDASGLVEFGTAAAVAGARQRVNRWRAELDPRRLGGATQAVEAVTVLERPPAALELRLRLPGPDGGAAAEQLMAAFATGAALEPTAPCPPPTSLTLFGLSCDGEILVTPAGQAAIAAAPLDGVVVAERGPPALVEVAPGALVTALGLVRGDVVTAIDGEAVDDGWPAMLRQHLQVAAVGAVVTVRFRRAGRALALRYRLVR